MNPKRGRWLHAPWVLALHRHGYGPDVFLKRIGLFRFHGIGNFVCVGRTVGHCADHCVLCATLVYSTAVEKFTSGL